jgi:integrase
MKVKPPQKKKKPKEMLFWERDEFEKFISVVDDDMYRCLFSLLFYTGRRKGEIFALEPKDFKHGKIHVYKNITYKTLDDSTYKITTTKAEKEGWSDICPAAQKALDAYQGQSPFFFGGEKPLPPETVRKRFKRYIKKAEVKEIRIHDLRHSFVSMAIHLGATLPVVADLIDDTLEQVTETYAHMYPSDKAEILAKIE